jgi:acetyl-CoA synthetase
MSRYKINNLEEYFKEYKKSVREPSSGTKLLQNFTWYQEWEKVVDFNMAEANIKWFVDAKVNITKIVLTDTLPKKQNRNHFEPKTLAKKRYIFPILNYTNAFVKWPMYLQEQGIEKRRSCLYICR